MSKLGWKEGQGLGKESQGIAVPLMISKTGDRTGTIAGWNESKEGKIVTTQLQRVVLLKNMVAPGEVDEYLEEETADECSKYGKVLGCRIFEVPSRSDFKIPASEAVRIFVQFESSDSARRAIQNLNGRFFAGRQVSATFFDEDRYVRYDFAPKVEEIRTMDR